MPLNLWLLVACRPGVYTDTDSPTSTPVPTLDTDTDIDIDDGPWEFQITQLYGFGSSIAILQTDPEIIVAIARAGENGQDGVRIASAAVYHLDPRQHTVELRVALPDPQEIVLSIHLETLGDVTFDGEPDLGVQSNLGLVEPGPFNAFRASSAVEVPGAPYSCDADSVQPLDLCLISGIDFGPFDGQVDVTWALGDSFSSATFSRTAGYLRRFQNFNFPRIVRVPLELRGTVVVDEQATWEPTGFQFGAFAVVDTHADGSEELLVCGLQVDTPGLRLLDDFPTDSPVRMTFDANCDALEVADFTGDGLPEVAVGAGARVSILDPRTWTVLSEHEGTFQQAPPLQDGYGRAMDSADLNGDGRMDLIIGAPGVGSIYVLTEVVPQGVDP